MNQVRRESGFSIVELLVVIGVVAVLSAIAVFSLNNVLKYATDTQARSMTDLFDEARQKALNQRTTFRVEINKTKNRLVLIDENTTASSNDDVIVKSLPLSADVTVGVKPANISADPSTTSPIPVMAFKTTNYPLSSGDQKITLRFRRNGQVIDDGTDGLGSSSVVTGCTIYLYSTKQGATNPKDIRTVTVLGTTGDTSVLGCQFDANNRCVSWTKF